MNNYPWSPNANNNPGGGGSGVPNNINIVGGGVPYTPAGSAAGGGGGGRAIFSSDRSHQFMSPGGTGTTTHIRPAIGAVEDPTVALMQVPGGHLLESIGGTEDAIDRFWVLVSQGLGQAEIQLYRANAATLRQIADGEVSHLETVLLHAQAMLKKANDNRDRVHKMDRLMEDCNSFVNQTRPSNLDLNYMKRVATHIVKMVGGPLRDSSLVSMSFIAKKTLWVNHVDELQYLSGEQNIGRVGLLAWLTVARNHGLHHRQDVQEYMQVMVNNGVLPDDWRDDALEFYQDENYHTLKGRICVICMAIPDYYWWSGPHKVGQPDAKPWTTGQRPAPAQNQGQGPVQQQTAAHQAPPAQNHQAAPQATYGGSAPTAFHYTI